MWKLHRWQFYLGELQGLDNAPLKYDDRLEGMYPGPFHKLHKTLTAEKKKKKLLAFPAEVVTEGQKSTPINLAHQPT